MVNFRQIFPENGFVCLWRNERSRAGRSAEIVWNEIYRWNPENWKPTRVSREKSGNTRWTLWSGVMAREKNGEKEESLYYVKNYRS